MGVRVVVVIVFVMAVMMAITMFMMEMVLLVLLVVMMIIMFVMEMVTMEIGDSKLSDSSADHRSRQSSGGTDSHCLPPRLPSCLL